MDRTTRGTSTPASRYDAGKKARKAGAAHDLGLTLPSAIVNAAIIAGAPQDSFKTWFLTAASTLPDNFELAV